MRDEDDVVEIVIKRRKSPDEFNLYDATGGWLGSPDDGYEEVVRIERKKGNK